MGRGWHTFCVFHFCNEPGSREGRDGLLHTVGAGVEAGKLNGEFGGDQRVVLGAHFELGGWTAS